MIPNATFVTIKSGESLSNGADLVQDQLIGAILPAAWTAADITFQGSLDGVTYGDLLYEGIESSSAAAAGQYLVFSPFRFQGIRFIKVRSGSSALPVAQATDRTITLIKSQGCC